MERQLDSRVFECNFQDVVSDVDWNNNYNMFALSGFGQEFPILVYVYERDNKEYEEMSLKYADKLRSNVEDLVDHDTAYEEDDPQNRDAYDDASSYGMGRSRNLDSSIGKRSYSRDALSEGPSLKKEVRFKDQEDD